MKLSVIIPAKNEEFRIFETLVNLYFLLSRSFSAIDFEVIIVLNNCTDRTLEKVQLMKKDLKMERLIIYDIGQAKGKGEAILFGFQKARGEYVAFYDADGSCDYRKVVEMYHYMRKDVDIDTLITDRYHPGSRIRRKTPGLRELFGRMFNALTRILFLHSYNDTQCGLKMFKKEVIGQVVHQIRSKSWTFDLELILLIKIYGYKIKNIPLDWTYKKGSTFKILQAIFVVCKELVVLFFTFYYRLLRLKLNHFYKKR